MNDTLNTNTSEPRLRRFEDAWLHRAQNQPIPDWRQHLPADEEPCRPEWLADLLRRDIEYRIKAGLPALLSERYFEHPRLRQLEDAQRIELIRWEYQQRWQNGERAQRGEYQAAFPQFADALRELQPSCACPSCRRTIAVEETAHTLHCPHCDSESRLPTVSPLLVAALVLPEEEMPGFDLRDYRLVESLGQGGMGEVYRADDPALERDLAIKVMKEQYRYAAHAESRFLREARITGALQHPGIVPIYNLGRLRDGRLHYTMRLVRGRTFADILRQQAGQTEHGPTLLAIFEKVCQAVAYAHSKRVIHRDLKPQNIMVGAFGEVQVMDWGLAKRLPQGEQDCVEKGQKGPQGQQMRPGERGCVSAPSMPLEALTQPRSPEIADTPDLTQTGSGMGTPAYMPPEQAQGQWDTVDERADVFALGAILCEILTGQPPYRGRDVAALLEQAKRGDTKDALDRLQRAGADAALTALCRECLSADREARPRDAGAVARRMAEYQTEVQARLHRAEVERGQAQVQAREERKRRRLLLVSLLLLSAAALLAGWLAVRAGDAEKKAVAERDDKEAALQQAQDAAQAERQARKLAQHRQRQIEKANEVLASIFHDLNPRAEEKGGPPLRQQLGQHLDRAAKQLEEAALDDPVTIAQLRLTLGSSLVGLGQSQRALELLEKARATLETKLGADHSETLTAGNNLAEAYHAAGRIADAIRLHKQILRQREAKLGVDHPDTLVSRNNLAQAYQAAGRAAEVVGLHEQNLRRMEAKLGADHPDTLISRNNLAQAYQAAGRNADAIRLLEQTLQQSEAKRGADHPDTLHARSNLAEVYRYAGRTADAIRLFEQTLRQSEAKLGTDHPDTLITRNNLATAYQNAGRIADAIPLFEQTVRQQEGKLGSDHPATLRSRNNLALAYYTAGRTADALRLFEQALRQMETKFGSDHPETLTSRNNLAGTYYAVGRTADAIRLLEQTLRQREATLGTDHPDTLTTRNNLATAYQSAGRASEAIRLHEQTLKQREAKLGSDHPDTLGSRNNLANAYNTAGRSADAIRLYEQTLPRMEAKLGSDHPLTLLTLANLGVAYRDADRLSDAISRLETAQARGRQRRGGLPASLAWLPDALAQTYERAKQFAKAEAIYRDFLRQAQKQLGPDDPRTAGTMAQLGGNLLQQKKFAEAESVLRKCLAIRDKKQADAWNTFNTRSALGEALVGQKKYTDAEPLLVQGYEGLKQRQDKIPSSIRKLRLREALQRLVQLYDGWGKKDQADQWRKTPAD